MGSHGNQPSQSEASQLKYELEAVTIEANKRIEKANETILRMKSQLREMTEKQAPPLVRLHAEAKRRYDIVEAQGQELQRSLNTQDFDVELDQLRGEVAVLTDQKEALMESIKELCDRTRTTGS